MRYQEIVKFWFEEITPAQWFKKDDSFDNRLRIRFRDIHEKAHRCELFAWRESAEGRLAEIIVLDQFSRNLYRDSPLSFASDNLALALAQEAVHCKDDQLIPIQRRSFLYMPFMHSESKEIHRISVELFSAKGMEFNLEYELKHKEIIEKFGRYPHRNKIMGRISTPEELSFLEGPGSSF